LINPKKRKRKRKKGGKKNKTTKQNKITQNNNDKNDNNNNNYNTQVHYCYQHTNTPLQYNIHVSKVHYRSAVRFSWALPGYPITAHYLYGFLL